MHLKIERCGKQDVYNKVSPEYLIIETEMKTKPVSFSLIIITLSLAFLTVLNPGNPLTWDVFGYYLYLPATFIYDDVALTNSDIIINLIDQYNLTGTFYQATHLENGNWVFKYSMGMAVLYAPAFFAGYFFALLTDYPADGFSLPYQIAMNVWSFLISLAGLYALSLILRRYFTPLITALALIIIFYGTNYLHIVTFSSSMPHNYLFTVYSLLILTTIKWRERGEKKYLILTALLCGICTLARPTEIISVIIPAFWGCVTFKDLINRYKPTRKKIADLFIFGSTMGLMGLPQLLYWLHVTGEPFYYSYNNSGEGLELTRPYLLEVLISFRKGWLIYTPVMVIALIGLILAWKGRKEFRLAIGLFFILNLYLVASWSTWWYADSFSQRALVQSYPLLAFPLAFTLQKIGTLNHTVKRVLSAIIVLIVLLNLFQTWQVSKGIIHTSRMTAPYYFKVFGKTAIPAGADTLLLVNRVYSGQDSFPPGRARQETVLLDKKFEQADSLSPEFLPLLEMKYQDLTEKEFAFLEIEMMIERIDSMPSQAVLVMTMEHKWKAYHYRTVDLSAVPANTTETITATYMTPEVRSEEDVLKVYVWFQSGRGIGVKEVKVRKLEPVR